MDLLRLSPESKLYMGSGLARSHRVCLRQRFKAIHHTATFPRQVCNGRGPASGAGARVGEPRVLIRPQRTIFWKHLPQTIEFVDRHPNQPFVVDHIAKPRIESENFDSEWAAGIRELAKREHVFCKVSGMLTEVRGGTWDLDLLRPYFETVYEAFGPQRVMFGSDWPVCLLRSSHAVWTRICADLTKSPGADERAAFWGGNAARIYGF